MEYPLGPVPWALATPDGMPMKTNKAVLMQKLEDVSALQIPAKERNHVHIIGGNALFHAQTHLPETFGELAYNIFCALPKVANVHFITDNYQEHSIKSLERIRRGESQAYIVRGSSTKLPRECKSFLKNDDNKKHFIQFLLNEWQQDAYAKLLLNREVIFASDNDTADGETTDARLLQNLSSSHEEADTLLILHSIYADQAINSTDTDIIIRSPDTDEFLLLIAFCQKYTHPIYLDTALKFHCLRANYQTLIWKQADIAQPDIPDSKDHGWKTDGNGVLSIHWCTDLVPQELADILSESHTTRQQESVYDDDIESDVDSDAESQNFSDSETSEEEEESG
ncbi:hypothetical protein ElyMa_006138800 [Elysia marginata]|uniref:Uncharacterized protein n=1 Tax=Elysia marginata TaxID=1093978 RepID=A0AAV4GWT9_9GAST|nr:hypothetical protein ElyMa_006138800 [Elysia marginata]